MGPSPEVARAPLTTQPRGTGSPARGQEKAYALRVCCLPKPGPSSEPSDLLLQAASQLPQSLACLPPLSPGGTIGTGSLGALPLGGPGPRRGREVTLGQHDPSRGLPSPAEEKLWTTRADGRVRPRVHPACPQPPYTVHRMFSEALDKYGDLHAMGFKRQGTWEHISYSQYYQLARKAAKGFLKVRALETQPSLPSPGFRLWTPVGSSLTPNLARLLGE